MRRSPGWAGATIKPSVGIHHEPRPGRGDDEPAAHAARRRSFRLHRLRAAPTYRWPTSPTSSNKGGPDGGEQERKLAPSSSSSSSNRLGGIHLALETLEPLSACPPALPGSRRATRRPRATPSGREAARARPAAGRRSALARCLGCARRRSGIAADAAARPPLPPGAFPSQSNGSQSIKQGKRNNACKRHHFFLGPAPHHAPPPPPLRLFSLCVGRFVARSFAPPLPSAPPPPRLSLKGAASRRARGSRLHHGGRQQR